MGDQFTKSWVDSTIVAKPDGLEMFSVSVLGVRVNPKLLTFNVGGLVMRKTDCWG